MTMSRASFDFDRLRQNWERARAAPPAQPSAASNPRVAQTAVRAATSANHDDERLQAEICLLDERHTLDSTWRQVKATIARDYAAHAAALEVFVAEIDRLLVGAGGIALPDPQLRLNLEAALADLEDLLEVFGGYGRP
jgi:hypothetical protein